ncbi:sulfate/thiosulfate import ATP-binding protein CysA [Agaricicola taiwanensis]|uniref:Sulfate/thiosulfate import ATP-binding protein CysA n=1 Tax=Agaricicola taiwanensis TaxID=591372 RepID=A0A8J2VHL8_9RHOB|nr:TOBE-like domain-containing protein [Agaricicola taiwanensis]GGE30663.1 sulfate/thiosulfate import ATP-binding protein CysA [Agaricicola taiwanensis]
MNIDVAAVTKQFGTFTALNAVDLHIASGELLALLGPSGSGKTTLLRIIAGLEWPDSGEVRFDGQDALDRSVRERDVGFVFQHYALFRHMSVFENIAFGLRVKPRRERKSEAEIRAHVSRLLELVQIGELADRFPAQLSGGQRQRVALARALAIEPKVLLLDEPFGALDAKVRKDLRRWLRHLHEELHVTSILVTHDQEEALDVADRVVVMDRGQIVQVGSAQDIYEQPATSFVHDFIGESIVLNATLDQGAVRVGEAEVGRTERSNGRARLFVRPHDVSLVTPQEGPLTGEVRALRALGPNQRVEIALDDITGESRLVEVEAGRNRHLGIGEKVGLKLDRYRLFEARP